MALEIASIRVLMGVGEADGKLDKNETSAFVNYLISAATFPNGLPKQVLISTIGDLPAAIDAFVADKQIRTPESAFREVSALVDRKVPRIEALMYKVALFDLGSTIALASGRLFRPKVSRAELKNLAQIQEWLGLDDTEARSAIALYNMRKNSSNQEATADSRKETMHEDPHSVVDPNMQFDEIVAILANAIESGTSAADSDRPDLPQPARYLRSSAGDKEAKKSRRSSKRIPSRQRGDPEPSRTPGRQTDRVDIGTRIVERTFEAMCVDNAWSERDSAGYSWWAHRLRQRIEAQPPTRSGDIEVSIVTACTDLVAGIEDVNEAINAANAINMSAGMSAIIVGQDGRSRLGASVAVHSGALHYGQLFSLAAAFQVAEAHALLSAIADSLSGYPDITSHPTSGIRGSADGMLHVLDDIPKSRDLVPLGRPDFERALASMRSTGFQSLVVDANTSDHGLTAEFPFYHSTPAKALDPRDANEYLGTAILTLAVRDRQADSYWASRGTVQNSYPILDRHTGAATRYGSGLYVRLALPVTRRESELVLLAAELNRLEIAGVSKNHLIGAWYAEAEGLWFTAYYPNLLLAPLSMDGRATTLVNIIASQAARTAWARTMVDDHPANKHQTNRPPSSDGSNRITPQQLPSFRRFESSHPCPDIVSCYIATSVDRDSDPSLPPGTRVELWTNCESAGLFTYLHLAVAFDKSGEIAAIAAAETLPAKHDRCFLGLFANGAHANFGESEEWRQEDRFLVKALPILAEHLR